MNVVGYDYTGYGASIQYETRPTEEQTYIDIEAVYDWVCEYNNGELVPSGVPRNHVIVYGQSVGSGPSCYLASGRSRRLVGGNLQSSQKRMDNTDQHGEGVPLVDVSSLSCLHGPKEVRGVAGMVLHSPIMSGIRVLTMNRCLACCDIYPNVDFMKTVSAPVFIIHGDSDREVPVLHGRGLQERVPETHRTQPWWVPNRGHNDVLQNNEEEFFYRMMSYLILVRNRQNVSKTKIQGNDTTANSISQVVSMNELSDRQKSDAAKTIQMINSNAIEKDYESIALSAAAVDKK